MRKFIILHNVYERYEGSPQRISFHEAENVLDLCHKIGIDEDLWIYTGQREEEFIHEVPEDREPSEYIMEKCWNEQDYIDAINETDIGGGDSWSIIEILDKNKLKIIATPLDNLIVDNE